MKNRDWRGIVETCLTAQHLQHAQPALGRAFVKLGFVAEKGYLRSGGDVARVAHTQHDNVRMQARFDLRQACGIHASSVRSDKIGTILPAGTFLGTGGLGPLRRFAGFGIG